MIESSVRVFVPQQLAALAARPPAKQFIRYALAGFAVTQMAALIYSILAARLQVNPFEANLVSTGCGFCMAYLVHDGWSFAGGAAKDGYGKITRFAASTLLAFLVNSLWVWLFVSEMHLSSLAPVPLMMFVTPWASFVLNRYWVFQAHRLED